MALDLGMGTSLGIEPITYFHSLRSFDNDSHILRPCMIASKTIQDNGDRMYNISFVLFSHSEENNQKEGFRDLKPNKWKPKSKSTRKTQQDRPCWKILTSVNDDSQNQRQSMLMSLCWCTRLISQWWRVLMSLGLTWLIQSDWCVTTGLARENAWRRSMVHDNTWARVSARPNLQVAHRSTWNAR